MSAEEKDAQRKSTWRRMILDFMREERDHTKVRSTREKESYTKLMSMYKEHYGEVETEEYKQECARVKEERERKALIQSQRDIPNPHPNDTKGWFEKIKQVGPCDKYNKVDWYNDNFGWAVPNEQAIRAIVDFVGNDTLLEVGAGYGLWGMLLRSVGCKAVITDKEVCKHQYTTIEISDGLTAISAHQECNVLMMIWPHPADSWIDETLAAFKGNKFILIGEPMTDMGIGCTDIPQDLDNWELVTKVFHPNFSTFSEVQMYKRK